MLSVEGLSRIIHMTLAQVTTTRHSLWSAEAEELLIMIAAHESRLGKLGLTQIGGGPARGIFQVEISTMADNYRNFIDYRPRLAKQLEGITGCGYPSSDQLKYNPIYGVIHARLKLYRSPGKIPTDTPMLADYAKEYYNAGGSATAEDYLLAYYEVRKM